MGGINEHLPNPNFRSDLFGNSRGGHDEGGIGTLEGLHGFLFVLANIAHVKFGSFIGELLDDVVVAIAGDDPNSVPVRGEKRAGNRRALGAGSANHSDQWKRRHSVRVIGGIVKGD
jgi:hypothetical protein